MPKELDSIGSDLSYVRSALARREGGGGLPMSIAVYWAIAVCIGFALVDFAPRATGLFWLITGPLGFVYSTLAGRAEARASGEANVSEGQRIMLHFGGMLAAIFLALFLLAGGADGNLIGRVTLLIVALAYYLAAVHFARGLYLASLILAAGFVALAFLHSYVWTVTGLLTGVALLASAFIPAAGKPNA